MGVFLYNYIEILFCICLQWDYDHLVLRLKYIVIKLMQYQYLELKTLWVKSKNDIILYVTFKKKNSLILGIKNKNIIKCFEKHKNYRISNSIVGYVAIIIT